jgi:hypothetical protein
MSIGNYSWYPGCRPPEPTLDSWTIDFDPKNCTANDFHSTTITISPEAPDGYVQFTYGPLSFLEDKTEGKMESYSMEWLSSEEQFKSDEEKNKMSPFVILVLVDGAA